MPEVSCIQKALCTVMNIYLSTVSKVLVTMMKEKTVAGLFVCMCEDISYILLVIICSADISFSFLLHIKIVNNFVFCDCSVK